MVCSSPACPPQAMFTEVIGRINASCVPSAMASGNSPISLFKSILKPPLFIPKSNPPMPSGLPVLSIVLSPSPNSPVRIESHPAGEADPGYEDLRKSLWQSSDSRQSLAPHQKE